MPPKPEKDDAGGFFQLFWAKGNNPSRVERLYADMWEHDLIKLYKGLFHANPGGFTYTEGWSELIWGYAEIMDENTRLRQNSKKPQKVAAKEQGMSVDFGEDNGRYPLGTALMAIGFTMIWRRKRKPK